LALLLGGVFALLAPLLLRAAEADERVALALVEPVVLRDEAALRSVR
jgi:hypothetical protein